MTTILGIDAAWTEKEPSGVALVSSTSVGWRNIAVAPSYQSFIGLAAGQQVDWNAKTIKGCSPDVPSILDAAKCLAGEPVHIITIDMPMAKTPITSRRKADDEVSRVFGSRWCSAHSPNSDRPGKISDGLFAKLESSGYKLLVDKFDKFGIGCLLEVYPHTALLSLLRRDRRVPYKVSKSRKYWPGASDLERKQYLFSEFQAIYNKLEACFGTLDFNLPEITSIPSFSYLKRFEDGLDALVVCLDGHSVFFWRCNGIG